MASYTALHRWDLTPQEAVSLQRRLRSSIRIAPLAGPIELVAGADVSFDRFSPIIYAGIVVVRLPSLEVVEECGVVTQTRFPYIPGLLSFRETPAVLEAWSALTTTPDAIMLDGQGLAHPRRFGIACHLGLLTDRPAFGCAKSVLVGKYTEPPRARGHWTPLVDGDEQVGAALRTKDGVQPIFVSPGHRIDLDAALRLTLACHGGYRQPEPTRLAHHLVNRLRRAAREKRGE